MPCAVEPFGGARFQLPRRQRPAGRTDQRSFPRRGSSTSARSRVGFIGMTLKGTAQPRHPVGREGPDASRTRRRPQTRSSRSSKAEGADAIVLLIHQGGTDCRQFTTGNGCDGLYGDILPILAEARSGDHDRRVGPHALGLCLQRHRRDGRRAPADQRREERLFRHRPPPDASIRSHAPADQSGRRRMSSSETASVASDPGRAGAGLALRDRRCADRERRSSAV